MGEKMDLHQGPGGPRGPGGPPGPQGPHPKRQFFHNKIKNFHFSAQNAQEADPNGQKWPKMAKIGQNLRKFPKISEKLQFLQILILVAQMGTWDWQKSKNQKKAPGFLPPAQLLPPHHLLTLSTSDTMQHVHLTLSAACPTVWGWWGWSVWCSTWVQHCGHCGGDDDVVPHSMGQHQCSTPTRWSTVQWCCAQHSTAVKSIGSIISRGSIIASSHAAAFFDFCKEWVELPLWGRWNYFFWFFLFLHLQGGCKYPQNQKIAFFDFWGSRVPLKSKNGKNRKNFDFLVIWVCPLVIVARKMKNSFSYVPSCNSLVSVSDPWRAFWADTAPFKGPRLASCVASGTTEIKGHCQVCRVLKLLRVRTSGHTPPSKCVSRIPGLKSIEDQIGI